MPRVQAAPPRASGYPRLKQAWRLLVGAAPLVLAPGAARGDASTPPCPNHANGTRLVPVVKGDMPAPRPPEPPAPKAKKTLIPPSKLEPPPLQGLFGRRVAPPDARSVAFVVDEQASDEGFVIHPHGPDEPCRRRG